MRPACLLFAPIVCLWGGLLAAAPGEQALLDKGLRLINTGRFEAARFTLQTLVNVYPNSSLTKKAKDAIRESWMREGVSDVDALLLYQEGLSRLAQGRYEAARLAWQTLLNISPDSRFAAGAEAAIRESRKQEKPGP
jgi:TolA-binding protein